MILTRHDEFTQQCSCGELAYVREVVAKTSHTVRKVCYHIHEQCMTHDDHGDRLKEIDAFVTRMDEIQQALNDAKLEPDEGLIRSIELGYVQPDACGKFEKARIFVLVSWNKHESESEIGTLDVLETEVDDKLKSFIVHKAAAEVSRIKQEYERGKL